MEYEVPNIVSSVLPVENASDLEYCNVYEYAFVTEPHKRVRGKVTVTPLDGVSPAGSPSPVPVLMVNE
jgi:hypothetical protein